MKNRNTQCRIMNTDQYEYDKWILGVSISTENAKQNTLSPV